MTKEQAIQQKIKQITSDMNKRYEKTDVYIDYGLVTLVAGGLLYYSMHLIFDVWIDDWIKEPAAQFHRQMWNVLMYAIPWTFYALGCGAIVTGVAGQLLDITYEGICRIFRKLRAKQHVSR